MQPTSNPARAPKGVPTGGQFAAESKPEPESSLPIPVHDSAAESLDTLLSRESDGGDSRLILIDEVEHGDSALGMVDVEYNPTTGKYVAAATADHFNNNGDETDDFLVDEYDIVPTDDGDHIVAQAILDPRKARLRGHHRATAQAKQY